MIMKIPNFLVIGAAKSGTTSLYQYLKQHPQIYMSPRKELKFFALEGESPNFRGPGDEPHNCNAITDIETYQSYFQGVVNETAIGEASPRYIYIPKAAERIKYHIPNAKMIAILRNPVDRAYSSFMHQVRKGRESLSFAQALLEEDKRIENNWAPLWHYKQMGFYYTQLKRYFDLFESRQIKIYLYEDLETNSTSVVKEIFRFLEVDDTFIPDNTSIIYNKGGVPKNNALHELDNALHELVHRQNLIKSALKPFLPSKLRKFIKKTFKQNLQNLEKPKLPFDIRRQLTQEYRADITKLQDLIQRDLSTWIEN